MVNIFTFHNISNAVEGTFVNSTNSFENILHWISDNYDEFIDSSELLMNPRFFYNSKKKFALITFDDGYEDIIYYGLPILKKYTDKAILFIPTKYIDKYNLWNPRSGHIIKHMNIQQINTWIEEGYEIGSHTHSHNNLIKFSRETIHQELEGSLEHLKTLFPNVNINAIAYPYGSFNSLVIEEASKLYKGAFSVNQGIEFTPSRLYEINRVSINNSTNSSNIKASIRH